MGTKLNLSNPIQRGTFSQSFEVYLHEIGGGFLPGSHKLMKFVLCCSACCCCIVVTEQQFPHEGSKMLHIYHPDLWECGFQEHEMATREIANHDATWYKACDKGVFFFTDDRFRKDGATSFLKFRVGVLRTVASKLSGNRPPRLGSSKIQPNWVASQFCYTETLTATTMGVSSAIREREQPQAAGRANVEIFSPLARFQKVEGQHRNARDKHCPPTDWTQKDAVCQVEMESQHPRDLLSMGKRGMLNSRPHMSPHSFVAMIVTRFWMRGC